MQKKYLKLILAVMVISIPVILMGSTPNDPYNYKEVKKLESQGKPKQASTILQDILDKAFKNQDNAEVMHAIMYMSCLESSFQEDAELKNIERIRTYLEKSGSTLNADLKVLLANAYQEYYSRYSYKIGERPAQIGTEQDTDIQHWSEDRFNIEISKIYVDLLQNTELLNQPISDFSVVLNKMQAVHNTFQQNMYDVFAYQAIRYFQYNYKSSSNSIQDFFAFDQEGLFDKANQFLKMKFPVENTDPRLMILRVYSSLLKAHKNDKDPDAFQEANIRRLEYVSENYIGSLSAFGFENKDQLYIQRLKDLLNQYKGQELYSFIAWKLASKYNNLGKSNPKSYPNYLKEAYSVAESGSNAFPKSLGGINCLVLLRQLSHQSFNVTSLSCVIPEKDFLMKLEYTNTDRIFTRIYKVTQAERQKIEDIKYDDKNAIFNQIVSREKVKEDVFELPQKHDYRSHNLELPFEGLPLGSYFLLASSDKSFNDLSQVSYLSFDVSSLSYVFKENENREKELVVLDRENGKPLRGVEVKVFSRIYDYNQGGYKLEYLKSYYTDKEGFVVLSSEDYDKSNNSFEIELHYKDDVYRDNNNFSLSRSFNSSSKARLDLNLFTDRAIYRPGQEVFYKGILLEKNDDYSKIPESTEVKVQFYDVNRKVISEQLLYTDDFGGINGSFVIPAGQLTGSYKISSSYGYKNIQVEEYKRPSFQVNIDKFKGENILGDSIHIKGNIRAFAGYMIPDAEVKYFVRRKPNFWFGYGHYSSELVALGSIKTNSKGEFNFQFKTPKVLQEKNEDPLSYTYNIQIEATNLSGETQTKESYIGIGTRSVVLNSSLKEREDLSSFKEFYIQSRNYNDEFIPAKGNIQVYEMDYPRAALREQPWSNIDIQFLPKDKFVQRFPNDPYVGEMDKENWSKKLVYNSSFNTAQDSMYLLPFKKWGEGIYMLHLKTKDISGNNVEYKKYVTFFDSNSKEIPLPLTDWFVSSVSDRGEAKVGSNVYFLLGSKSDNKSKVLYSLYSNGKLLQRKWLDIRDKQMKIELPILESYRGELNATFIRVEGNRMYKHNQNILVPYDNKKLNIQWNVLKDKLNPGTKEKWTLQIKDNKNFPVAASVLASMYDASLDEFASDNWSLDLWLSRIKFDYSSDWGSFSFGKDRTRFFTYNQERDQYEIQPGEVKLESPCDHNFATRGGGRLMMKSMGVRSGNGEAADISEKSVEADDQSMIFSVSDQTSPSKGFKGTQESNNNTLQLRKNFKETAFFYPNLKTNKDGDVLVEFTLPESLTKWKFRTLAYTKDLKVGKFVRELTASKDLMIAANSPRFLREGDQIDFPVSVINTSEKDLDVSVDIQIINPETEKPIEGIVNSSDKEKQLKIKKGQTIGLSWNLKIPDNISVIKYRVVVRSDNFSDGEENIIPVLSNRTLVTSSQVIEVNGTEEKSFQFDELLDSEKSKTSSPYRLSFEFTNNPVWYAIQALPSLLIKQAESSDQYAAAYYAAAMGSYIVNSNPKIQEVFELWRKTSPDQFLSNLEKNQDLKKLVLDQTPWLLDAKNESEQKRRVAAYFDVNTIAMKKSSYTQQLRELQLPDGSYSWFKGMRGSWYSTQNVWKNMLSLAHNKIIDLNQEPEIKDILSKATQWLDKEMVKEYMKLKEEKGPKPYIKLSSSMVEYVLYRTYFIDTFSMDNNTKEIFNYYQKQSRYEWLKQSYMIQGMVALIAKEMGNEKTAQDIVASLKDKALYKPNLGMYWRSDFLSFLWFNSSIETQSFLIHVFDKITGDQKSVNRMKQWLIKNKQTNSWPTSRATIDAIGALVFTGKNLLDQEPQVQIQLGNVKIDSNNEKKIAGTGFISKTYLQSDIKPEMGNIKVDRQGEGPAFGAVYFQYFEDLDKVKSSAKDIPLHIEKILFVKRNSDKGINLEKVEKGTEIKVGDEILVQLNITVDRDMDFVHLQDLRASGFEPKSSISGFQWKEGLGYYLSIKDASVDFFFDYINRGSYVLTYSLFVAQSGDFSNGNASLQSYYSPEFVSHSKGNRVRVNK
ncbi:MAG: alpha-2-macroglobulin family protein [Bacteroidales bacterium]